ncbi:MAG: glycosyltransferase family 4 protein [Nitrososphaerota archaeon]
MLRVLMVGRRKSIAFDELRNYWGEVEFCRPPKIPLKKHDIVIAQEPTLKIGPSAYLAAKLCRAKFIVEVHGEYLGWLKGIQRTTSIFLLRRADLIRVVTNRIAQDLNRMRLRRVVVIPSVYIKTDVFKPIINHEDREKLIIYTGRFSREKNLPLLLKAFKLLIRKEPSAKLLLIGKGSQVNKVSKLIKLLNIDKNTRLYDTWLPQEKLATYYNRAAIFALTSYYEGGPRAIFEAGACCTPFVSTKVGILYETVPEGVGGFYTSRDPQEIANKIIALLNDASTRQKMGENMRRIVLENFEWNTAIKRYAEAYTNLL